MLFHFVHGDFIPGRNESPVLRTVTVVAGDVGLTPGTVGDRLEQRQRIGVFHLISIMETLEDAGEKVHQLPSQETGCRVLAALFEGLLQNPAQEHQKLI